jgi:hypothetical protein
MKISELCKTVRRDTLKFHAFFPHNQMNMSACFAGHMAMLSKNNKVITPRNAAHDNLADTAGYWQITASCADVAD